MKRSGKKKISLRIGKATVNLPRWAYIIQIGEICHDGKESISGSLRSIEVISDGNCVIHSIQWEVGHLHCHNSARKQLQKFALISIPVAKSIWKLTGSLSGKWKWLVHEEAKNCQQHALPFQLVKNCDAVIHLCCRTKKYACIVVVWYGYTLRGWLFDDAQLLHLLHHLLQRFSVATRWFLSTFELAGKIYLHSVSQIILT